MADLELTQTSIPEEEIEVSQKKVSRGAISNISMIFILYLSLLYAFLASHLKDVDDSYQNMMPNSLFSVIIILGFICISIGYAFYINLNSEKNNDKNAAIINWSGFTFLALVTIINGYFIFSNYPELSHWKHSNTYEWYGPSSNGNGLDSYTYNGALDRLSFPLWLSFIFYIGLALRNYIKYRKPCKSFPACSKDYLAIVIFFIAYKAFIPIEFKQFLSVFITLFCLFLFNTAIELKTTKGNFLSKSRNFLLYSLLILVTLCFMPGQYLMYAKGGGPVSFMFVLGLFSWFLVPFLFFLLLIFWIIMMALRNSPISKYLPMTTVVLFFMAVSALTCFWMMSH